MRYALGIDVGATRVKAVVVLESGACLAKDAFDTLDAGSAPWAGSVADYVQATLRRHGPVEWIGVAAPGLAAPDETRIWWMQGRLAGIQDFDWTAHLKHSRFVPVLNDAQAALLGEVWLGAARGSRNVAMLTLGTGVGGAVVCDGRLLKGHLGRAGHFGHISLDLQGAPDIVQTPGSLEDAVGECTISARSSGRFATSKDLIRAHLTGDAQATDIWLRSVQALACGMASIINAIDPEVFILGGGLAKSGATLLDPLNGFLDRYEWRPHGRRTRVVLAELEDYAGALGAAWNAMRRDDESS